MNAQDHGAVPASRDHRQEVTDAIVKMLEAGVAPWQKPWESAGMPFNPATEKAYRGGNAIHLMATGLARGYDDPRWMTYNQASRNGWQVRKGEKGTQIEFWEVKTKLESTSSEPEKNGSEEPGKDSQRRLIHRIYTVFNAKQIEGVQPFERKGLSAFEAVHSGEHILANSGARISHDQRDRAFYRPSTDSIHLPPKEAFKEASGYYGTALHELAHWTGHPSRLNRSTLNDSYRFGDLNYAKEELRAELASVFIAAEVGVPHDPANRAAYVGSWIKGLHEDKNEIFRAAHDASAAADFVLGLEQEFSKADDLETDNSAGMPMKTVRATRTAAENFENDRDVGSGALHPGQRTAADTFCLPNGCMQTKDGSSDEASRDGMRASFAAAKAITTEKLGHSAKVFPAQTESGNYRGQIIGETELYTIQRLSAQSAIAHMKHLLSSIPNVGDNVGIGYVNNNGTVKEVRERSRTRELAR